jgi:hypothetical protein
MNQPLAGEINLSAIEGKFAAKSAVMEPRPGAGRPDDDQP